MPNTPLTPEAIASEYAELTRLRAELEERRAALARRAEALAAALAAVMEPGEAHYRIGVGLHAFAVGDRTCLAASYGEDVGDDYRYTYAVLCGGDEAARALRTAYLGGGEDHARRRRRIALATFEDYHYFLERLPRYLRDTARYLEGGLEQAGVAEQRLEGGVPEVAALALRAGVSTRPP